MRPRVEPRRLEVPAQIFERLARARIVARRSQKPVDRIEPEPDGLHVERRHRTSKSLSVFHELVARRTGRERIQPWEQDIEFREG